MYLDLIHGSARDVPANNGSAYYVAYSLLEMLLATVSALLMGSICYPVLVRATPHQHSSHPRV